MGRHFRSRYRLAALAVAIVTVGLVAPTALAAPSASTSPIEGIVSAGGQQQWISCAGSGQPTVVISSGLAASHTMWSKVLGPLRAITRVCISDRPGLGSSPARIGSKTTDAGQHASELRALLNTVGEKGPFILVGHSYAGLIVRAFAAQAPTDVAGMLLIDACWPGIHRDFLPSYKSPWHEGGTVVDMAASETADAGGPDLGRIPLIVLAAGDPAKATSSGDKAWFAHQAQAAHLSRDGSLRFALNSGHVVQQDKPAKVIAAVRDLVADVRARG
jgi:pimeloyl-ACP methyl ester carboxylesterase